MPNKITIRRPFNSHFHPRKGNMAKLTLPFTALQYGGGLPMPNCEPRIRTTADGIAYKKELLAGLPEGTEFALTIPFYLTDATDINDVIRGFQDGHLSGAKFYPRGATTGSDAGISSVAAVARVLKAMESVGMPLHIHGETLIDSKGKRLNPFRGQTESYFMGNDLMEILSIAPSINVFYEHISLPEQAAFVNNHENMRATITPMHLGYDQCDYLQVNGKRMWNLPILCLPVLKDRTDVDGLWEMILRCIEKYAAGDDSAPHDDLLKASLECGGCSGAFVAPTSLEQYATIFESRGQLGLFERFMTNGWLFQKLAIPERPIELVREETITPKRIVGYGHSVTPFQPGSALPWRLSLRANEIQISTCEY